VHVSNPRKIQFPRFFFPGISWFLSFQESKYLKLIIKISIFWLKIYKKSQMEGQWQTKKESL
jgi:hypothetical protein